MCDLCRQSACLHCVLNHSTSITATLPITPETKVVVTWYTVTTYPMCDLCMSFVWHLHHFQQHNIDVMVSLAASQCRKHCWFNLYWKWLSIGNSYLILICDICTYSAWYLCYCEYHNVKCHGTVTSIDITTSLPLLVSLPTPPKTKVTVNQQLHTILICHLCPSLAWWPHHVHCNCVSSMAALLASQS